jgi:ATP-dependent DNA ligase
MPSAARVREDFDLIELDGDDLRRNPLIVRKTTLSAKAAADNVITYPRIAERGTGADFNQAWGNIKGVFMESTG